MKSVLFRSAFLFLTTLLLVSGALAADEPGFTPIFDGQSLDGWKGEEGWWRVENGAIVGESTDDKPLDHNTFLVWERGGEIDDFELKLEFRLTSDNEGSANSGIQFRSGIQPDGHVYGYQADIDLAGNWVGALYDELGRGMLGARGQKVTISDNGDKSAETSGDAAELLQHVKKGDWNEYSITAQGGHITLKVNGHVTTEIIDNQAAERELQGVLALQLHSGPAQKIEFKNIRLKRLPLSEGRKKIVFIAGRPSHGWGAHEHYAGCALLSNSLNAAADDHGLPVLTTVYKNGWPQDLTAFDNADTVVFYCDGGGGHYVNDRLSDFDQLMERGVGLVCIHYAVEVPKGPSGEAFLKWIGGYFEPHWSVNPHWTASFDEFPDHPIAQGVEPFEINDEWYYHMRFVEGLEGVTPILTDMPPRETLSRDDGPHSGNPYVREAVLQRKEPQHVGWAYERPDGKGRGFGFTGGHNHRNWQDDNFRKTVLNAIVWTAGGEVPENGVESPTPSDEQMDANQDEPKPETAQREPRRRNRTAVAGNDETKPAYSSPVVSSSTPGHAVDIEVDIKGAKSLFLVVTDGGDGFSCDWADWAEPRLLRKADTRVSATVTVNGQPATDAVVEFRDADGNVSAGKTNQNGQVEIATEPGEKTVTIRTNSEKPVAADSAELKLTDLKWKAATSDWGSVRINKNAEGGELRINGRPVEFGIGTHANSIIEFALPEGHEYTTFTARGGLDNGGTNQGGGSTVQFHVFTERPGRNFLAKFTGGGGGGGSRDAVDALDQLDVHPDLEATLFASEPMLLNPTDIDVDHLGRVWVCEVVNYRRFANGDKPERTEGDRILILEDTDGDGVADESITFYQGRDVDSAHGICVLPTPDGKGTRAIISCGDSVFFLVDDDGDLKADHKEILFTGIDGTQHDHGIHAFVFGPDGKLYFNFGNAGRRIKDKDGQPIIDKAGNEVNDSRQPYQEGMVFRCNMDGSDFETLGWNFRNNWEVAVDSFGTMWQSDNDDDGNRGVRINYVMEFGNFGYRDEFTGAGWQTPRTGWSDEIPLRHFHQNDPGVVPNLLQTGAGSPTGICVYEGDLLPEPFRGALIHTDAGPNICRAYVTRPDGAGYTAEIVNILDGAARDKWFRPSDVCVGPDGSLFIADWYDPGVGGHRMGDVEHGRIFRITPSSSFSRSPAATAAHEAPTHDFSTPAGAATALQSPNLATRYMAWTALQGMGEAAVPALEELYNSDDSRHRARALWLLAKLDMPRTKRLSYLRKGLLDQDADIRVTAIRLARQLRDEGDLGDIENAINVMDPSPAVRREMLIGLREIDIPEFAEAWAILAGQYDGKDRWYLEALGIAAEGRWDDCLGQWLAVVGQNWKGKSSRDIIWRSRASVTPVLLTDLIIDPATPEDELPRYFRALDFQRDSQEKQGNLIQLAFSPPDLDESRVAFIQSEALNRLQGFDVAANPQHRAALDSVLENAAGSPQFVQLVAKFNLADRYPAVLALAQARPQEQIAIDAVKALLDKNQQDLINAALQADDLAVVEATMTALATSSDNRAAPVLLSIVNSGDQPLERRRAAVKALGGIRQGAVALQDLAQKGVYDPSLKEALAATLHTVQWRDVKERALELFPLPPGKDSEPIPPIEELAQRSGNVANGRIVFNTTGTCAKCHIVNTIGQNVGPDLSEIGKKLTRPALLESILYPSAAISHNFETWTVLDAGGNVVTGLLVSETPDEIQIKDEKGLVRTIKTAEVEEKKKQDVSLMPADLQKVLSVQDLVDVVEYMTTLKQAQQAAAME